MASAILNDNFPLQIESDKPDGMAESKGLAESNDLLTQTQPQRTTQTFNLLIIVS